MAKEIITQKHGIAIMVMFILGSALVLGTGGESKQDIWIAILIAIAMTAPVLFIYARLLVIFPGKGLYEILEIVFGKVIGRIAAVPFIWYAFHLGSLVTRNFTEFINIVSIPETPQYIIAIFMMVLCIWAVKAGVEVVGRWTSIVLPILIITIFGVSVLFIPLIDLKNIKPVLYEGIKPVLTSSFAILSFPFAETVVFTMILQNLKPKSSPYKVYYWGLLIGGLIILIVSVRNILVLGIANVSILYFPSYAAVRLINIGNFLQRIEVLVSMVFLFAGFIKINICLYGASTGIANLLGIRNYKDIVAPIGLLMMLLSIIIYRNTMEMFEWANKVYPFYSIPFELLLPVIILLAAEIKVRVARRKMTG